MNQAKLDQMAEAWENHPDWKHADLAAAFGVSAGSIGRLIRRGFRARTRPHGRPTGDRSLPAKVRRDHLWNPLLTVEQLADRHNVSPTTISRILKPDAHTIAFVQSDHAAGLSLEQISKDRALAISDVVNILRKTFAQKHPAR